MQILRLKLCKRIYIKFMPILSSCLSNIKHGLHQRSFASITVFVLAKKLTALTNCATFSAFHRTWKNLKFTIKQPTLTWQAISYSWTKVTLESLHQSLYLYFSKDNDPKTRWGLNNSVTLTVMVSYLRLVSCISTWQYRAQYRQICSRKSWDSRIFVRENKILRKSKSEKSMKNPKFYNFLISRRKTRVLIHR